MGLRFRKSINLGGGFRVNISKSGVGYSWGVPGYRVTKTAKGTTRKTYSIPGTGVSYAEENGTQQKKKTKSSVVNIPISQEELYTQDKRALEVGNIKEYQTSEYQEFLDAIKTYKSWDLLSNVLIIATLLGFAYPFFFLGLIIGIALKIYISKNLKISLDYEFDEQTKQEYDNRFEFWKKLNTAKSLWQITTTTKVTNKKQCAGADSLIERQKITIQGISPNFFKANIKFITLNLKGEQLILLPDKILIIKGLNVGAISYDGVNISSSDYKFIEGEKVPRDAEIVDHTWLKVNKNGTPDKRFKGNRQIPICKYGLITLKSSHGMDIRICCSKHNLVNIKNLY